MKVIAILVSMLFIINPVTADEEADSLLKCVENSGLGQASGFKFKQVIERESQAPRTFQAECYLADKADKVLITFEDPADMAGVKILLKDQGKQMWTYFPRTNRVRKMVGASSGRQIGSLGFSYDDLFPYLEGNNYDTKVVGGKKINGIACKIVEIDHSADANTTYKKSRVAVDEANCRLVQSRFFASGDRLLKTVTFINYTAVEGRTIPTGIKITQPDLGEKSEITVLAIEFDKDYGQTFFSELSLKR